MRHLLDIHKIPSPTRLELHLWNVYCNRNTEQARMRLQRASYEGVERILLSRHRQRLLHTQ